jgi:hypothetical protein
MARRSLGLLKSQGTEVKLAPMRLGGTVEECRSTLLPTDSF